jgi:hypothetical protein
VLVATTAQLQRLLGVPVVGPIPCESIPLDAAG